MNMLLNLTSLIIIHLSLTDNSTNINITDNTNLYYEYYDPKCDQIICDQGYCREKYTCKCNSGYANFNQLTGLPEKDENSRLCTYSQKEFAIALLLELILAFGVGHFYAGRYIYGVIKCFFTFVPFVLFVLLIKKKGKNSKFFFLNFSFFCCALFTWQLTDLILFLNGNHYDGNGVPFNRG